MRSPELSRRTFLSVAAGISAAALLKTESSAAAGANPWPSDELTTLTLRDAAALVRRREVSPVALTEACLCRIGRYEPLVNAFITVTPELARTQAREAEVEIAHGKWRGPLHGIPIALKDNIDTAGVRTSAGSAVFADRVPSEDAEVVRRLKAAGCVILGKLNMDEFAAGDASLTSHWGYVRNPWALDHVAGGSSGGSAAAVAADFCYGALGTDTGGSIRVPAAHCGVVGLKPSYGRVSNKGVIPLIGVLDCVGPICKTASDAALMLEAIAERSFSSGVLASTSMHDRQAALQISRRFRVGIPRLDFLNGLGDELRPSIDAALEVIASSVRSVDDVCFPFEFSVMAGELNGLMYEAHAYHAPLLERSAHLYHPSARSILGSAYSAADYAAARKAVERQRTAVGKLFRSIDLLVLPTVSRPARLIEPTVATASNVDDQYDFHEQGRAYYSTWAFSLLGLPAISVCCGFTSAGLPIGLQIVGPPWSERKVLALAHAYGAATSWNARKPPFQVTDR